MTLRGRRTFLLAAFALLTVPTFAQQVSGRFTTSLYTWERFDAAGSSHTLTRAYEVFQLRVAQGNVGFTTYLNGAMNTSDDFGDVGKIRVANSYLYLKDLGGVAEINLGRVPVFAGVGVGTVDGALVRARFAGAGVTLTGYGGANVRSDLTSSGGSNIGNNYLVGAQLVGSRPDIGKIGVSYVSRRLDREESRYVLIDPLDNQLYVPLAEQLVGVDAAYTGTRDLNLYGRYDYDINVKHTTRTQLDGRFAATSCLSFTGKFLYREPRVRYQSFFSVFSFSPTREYEGGIEYKLSCGLVSGSFGYVQYTGDLSRRLSLGFSHEYLNITYSGTNGFAGQLSSFNLEVCYPFLDYRLTPTAGAGFAAYREIDGTAERQEIYTGVLGLVVRPVKELTVDVQGQWLRNPVLEMDARFLGKVTYWFSHNLGGAE